MIRSLVLIGALVPAASMHAAQVNTPVTERDVAVFRAVIRAGLIPDRNLDDGLMVLPASPGKSRTGDVAVPVVSQTLRVCNQPDGDVGCVPVQSAWIVQNGVIEAGEFKELTTANRMARAVPANLILTVPSDHVFRGARTWTDVWYRRDRRELPESVQFTVPAYVDGAAILYAQRLWRARGWGWFVRLKMDAGEWRVLTKTLVWRSPPTA